MTHKNLRQNDFDYFTEIQARWRDMDGLRHINHAAYLTYMESARVVYYRNIGYGDLDRWDLEFSTILASMKVDYYHQSTFPNVYKIGHRISRIGGKSFDLLTGIYEDGNEEPIVVGTFLIVCFNYKEQKTVPVPEFVRKQFNPF